MVKTFSARDHWVFGDEKGESIDKESFSFNRSKSKDKVPMHVQQLLPH